MSASGAPRAHPDVVGVRVVVSGRVQGVWFRDGCREVARANGVAGWVRNCADGRVEGVFEGGADAVDRVVAWCRTGPPRAHVTALDARTEPVSGLTGFVVR